MGTDKEMEMTAAALKTLPTVDELAQCIRILDGNNSLGAGALAEAIMEWMQCRGAPAAAAIPAEPVEQLTVPDHIARDVEQAESADRWNEGVPFKSRWERKLYEGGFAAGWDRARALVPASTSAPAEPTAKCEECRGTGFVTLHAPAGPYTDSCPLCFGDRAPDAAHVGEPGRLPEGYKLYATKGLEELIEVLDRADRKGYLPDAVRDEWEAFAYRDAPKPTLATPTGVAADESTSAAPDDMGARYTVEFDGFTGTVIGAYKRLDGEEGVVMQQDGCKVVHVYRRKWLKPAPPPSGEVRLKESNQVDELRAPQRTSAPAPEGLRATTYPLSDEQRTLLSAPGVSHIPGGTGQ